MSIVRVYGVVKNVRPHKHLPPPSLEELGLTPLVPPGVRPSGEQLPKPKKFRFQLLAEFIQARFEANIRIADVGGGKGFLAYLLAQQGFEVCVIDPEAQELPRHYKDLKAGRRQRIPVDASVDRLTTNFVEEHGRDFDVLVGLHAHGSNLAMLSAAARFGCSVLLLPCCVIDEPKTPAIGQSWFTWLLDSAHQLDLETNCFFLNFKGQNVGFIASKAGC